MSDGGNEKILDLNAAICSVARHLRYTPETIGNLYFDSQDFYGLVYWYNDAVDSVKKIKETKPKNGGNS